MSVGSFLEPNVVPSNRYRPLGFAFGACKKNLVYVFGSEDDITRQQETIKVYLRLKPSCSGHNTLELMDVVDSNTLLVKASSGDDHSKRKNPDSKYTFSKIFNTCTTQRELFDECVNPLVKDFLAGQNCLLFSFGTTDAGKTFTIHGSAEQPGIIPRVLGMVFKSTSSKLSTTNFLCPHQVMSTIELTRNEVLVIEDLKNKILSWNQNDSAQLASNLQGSCENLSASQKFSEMQHILDREVKGIKCHDFDDTNEVSVWVSFIEIYNEKVFDLLDPCERGRKRKELKLAQDTQKNNYVKGVKYIPVKSEAEAYKVLVYGKHNLQIESTNLNSSSSRSHCIFTVKMLKCTKLSHSEIITVSSFSICDLAGSERQKKTLNTGDRLKESLSINSSLHVLNRCFNIIRENQLKNDKQLIPYRDSKLTQLFKRALSGHESVTMIVNISLSKTLSEETMYALKASAIAHQIIVQPTRKMKQSTMRSSRFSQLLNKRTGGASGTILWDSSMKSETSSGEERYGSCDSKSTLESSQIQKLQEEIELYLDQIENLHSRLKRKKEELRQEKYKNFTLEQNVRRELTTEFQKMLDESEAMHKKQLDSMWKSQDSFNWLVPVMASCDNRSGASQTVQKKRKYCDSEDSYVKDTENVIGTDNMQDLLDEIEQLKINSEDTQEELRIAQKKISNLTNLLEATKFDNAEMAAQINSLKMENGVLLHENKKLQQLAEGVQTGETKTLLNEIERLKEVIKDRDLLLEEARQDIEHEIKEREQAEIDLASLELELAVKDETIEKLNLDLENFKDLLTLKEERIEYLEEQLEQYSKTDEANRQLQNEIEDLRKALAEKAEELKSAEAKMEEQVEEANKKLETETENLKKTLAEKTDELKSVNAKILQQEEEANKKLENEIENWKKTLAERTEELKSVNVKIQQQEEEANKKLENEIENWKKTLAERTEELKSVNVKIQQQEELCAQLAKATSDVIAKEEQISDLDKEVKTLSTELKQEIQKSRELNEKITGNEEDLKAAISHVRELQEVVNFKDQRIKCMQNKLDAFEQTASILTAYKDEVENKNKELMEVKALSEIQATAITNLELEIASFQSNQKLINSKYEEQLRKCKEDVEREKRESARLRETWIKLTPTPKSKEEYVKRLEQQLETLTKSEEGWKKNGSPCNCGNQENKSKKNRTPCNRSNQENKSVQKKKASVAKSLLTPGVCTRSMKVTFEDGIAPLSEQILQSRSQRKENQYPLNVISNLDDKWSHDKSEQSLVESTKKSRRKLYSNVEQISTNDDDIEQIEEVPFIFRHSPNSVIKCNLRRKFDSQPS